MSKILLAAAILAVSAAPIARAAEAPGAPPAASKLGGPLIKGVCLLSQDQLLVNTKVAVAIDTRLKQLKAQGQAEIDADHGPIDADLRTLQADVAKTPPPPAAEIERRRDAIQARLQALQGVADQRNREMEATRVKALNRLSAELQPILAPIYKAHGCGLLLNRNMVMGGNMDADLTAEVIKALDAKITTMTFDREVLPPIKK